VTRLHIILWLWKGWRAIYDRRDINAVATMLHERCELPADTRILLLTDQPTDWYSRRTRQLGVEEYKLWDDPVTNVPYGRPNCFRRLRIFDPDVQRELGIASDDILMSMDADSVAQGAIGPMLAPFAARTHNFAAMEGMASRIHGSLFAFRAYSHQHVWRDFHPTRSPAFLLTAMPDGGRRPVGSDQAWMSRKVCGEHLWTRAQGCYSWNRHGAIFSPRYSRNAIYWSFAGHNKPSSELVRQVRPDLHEIWMDAYNRAGPA
jgi:hypothetical protein